MTPEEIRAAVGQIPLTEISQLVDDRNSDQVTNETIALLVGLGINAGWSPSWWRASAPDSGRRMSSTLRQVLDDYAHGPKTDRT